MHPELIRIGSFVLPTYGVLVATGFFVALGLLRRRAPRFGLPPDAAIDFGVWVLLAGLVGAKLLLVLVDGPSRYLTSLDGLKDLGRAGGVFYGGLLGAIVAAVLVMRARRMSFFAIADATAPCIAIGQAIGRLGCFSAGCCWGKECSLPWAVTFTDPVANANVGVPLNVPLHPSQLYEAVGTALLCLLILALEKRRFSGESFAIYLTGSAVLRFSLEFLRGDPRGSVGAFSTSQFIAAGLLALAVAVYFSRRNVPAESPLPSPVPTAP